MKKKSAKLFPFALARIAGGPLTDLEKLDISQTMDILNSLEELQNDVDKIKETLSEELHTFIGTITDTKQRNSLIQLRRDIHNERLTSFPVQFKETLPSSFIAKIKQYLLLLERKRQLLLKGEVSFEKEKKQSKKLFLKLLENSNFQNGILLSSNTLPESLNTYLKEIDKALPKIERSLMKYLSRMYTKPSPLSTFTSLAYATFSENDIFSSTDKKMLGKSHIELNHVIFHYISGLLIQNKNIRKYLRIKLNPTIYTSENQFVFLANNFNRESIQRINHTPALEVIINIMQKKENWLYNELINQLLTETFTTVPQKEMEDYIDNLLIYGFVEYDLGVSGLDSNWDKKLSQLITPLIKQFPYLEDLKKMLVLLRTFAKKYVTANTQKRKVILYETFEHVRQTCLTLHTAAELPEKERASFENSFSAREENKKESKKRKHSKKDELFTYEYTTKFTLQPQNLWYEDSIVDSQFYLSKSVEDSLNTFSHLLTRMGWFDSCSEQLFYYTDFFKKNYKETEKVDLLTFYEKYYRMERNKKKKEKNVTPEANKKKNKQFLDIFDSYWQQRFNDKKPLMIYEVDVAHIPQRKNNASFGSFFHLMSGSDGKPMIILNVTIPGFGKMYSRFLQSFPAKLTQIIRTWNEKTDTGALLAEVTDSSVFNANLHPNLMPYEITAPGSYTTVPSEKTISVTDIEIVYKKTDNLIHLMHKKNGKEIFIFDLGFQGIGGRSEIYNFLSKFTIGSHHHIESLINHINTKLKKKKKNEVVILPRIIYENCIVLQRKTWNIIKGSLPARQPQENDWSYFQKINYWRKKLSLPNEIFVKLEPDKPQYINFANPFLITILEKLIEKMKEKDSLKIEEMLPASKNLFSVNRKKFVTEFLAQWYS